MPCVHPIKAWRHKFLTDGKAIHLRAPPLKFKNSQDIEWLDLPCGKCIKCLQRKTMEWKLRMELEAIDHVSVWFLTLTYDDEHLPLSPSGLPTLKYDDVQKFLKRLRKNSGQKFRYFAAGEYGDRTQRPHYHLIVYGLVLDDLKPYNIKKGGYYVSEFIEKTWSRGNCLLAQGVGGTFAYCAGYVLKKQFGKKGDHYYLDRERPIARMSRNPGLGAHYVRYFSDNHFASGQVTGHSDCRKHAIPKYFSERMLKEQRFDLWEKVRQSRKQHARQYSAAELEAIEKIAQSKFNLTKKGVL